MFWKSGRMPAREVRMSSVQLPMRGKNRWGLQPQAQEQVLAYLLIRLGSTMLKRGFIIIKRGIFFILFIHYSMALMETISTSRKTTKSRICLHQGKLSLRRDVIQRRVEH